MLKQFSMISVCVVMASGAAMAQPVATAGSATGTVMVNNGSGFVRLADSAPLAAGDRLMAKKGGLVAITYRDGCVVKVKPGAIVSVGAVSPCSFKAQAGDDTRLGGIVPPLAPAGTTGLIVGGAAAAAIGGGIYLATQNNDNNFRGGGGGGGSPISP